MNQTEIIIYAIVNTILLTILASLFWKTFIEPARIKREWLGKKVRVTNMSNIYYDQVGKVELVLPYIGELGSGLTQSKRIFMT